MNCYNHNMNIINHGDSKTQLQHNYDNVAIWLSRLASYNSYPLKNIDKTTGEQGSLN